MRKCLRDHPRAMMLGVIAAATMLTAIAVVMIGVVFRPQPAAEASASPTGSIGSQLASPSASSPVITPSPTPDLPVVSDPGQPVLAVVLVDEVHIRQEPGGGAQIGTLSSGDIVAIAGERPQRINGINWYYVEAGQQRVGWVARGPADEPHLQLRSLAPVKLPASIEGVAVGTDQFLAWGWQRHRSDREATPAILVSTDGISWERSNLQPGPRSVVGAAAWGPAGWLAATWNPYDNKPGDMWHSTDGKNWERIDSIGLRGWIGESMTASRLGYAMSVRSADYDYDIAFSTDGRSWRVRHPVFGGAGPGGAFHILPSASGFIATGIDPEEGGSTQMARARDGVRWIDLGWGMPSTQTYQTEAGGFIWNVFVDDRDGRVRMQRAPISELDDVEFDMQAQEAMEERLAGSMVTALVSSADRVLMLAFDRSSGAAQLWSNVDGQRWTVKRAFGGRLPTILQGGPAGFIAVTEEATLAGNNPVFWHSADGETWTSDEGSSLGIVQSPRLSACPSLPSDYVEWRLIRGPLAADCFGDAAISFRAWLTVGGGCGGYVPGIFEPAWLAAPFASLGLVWLPYENDYGGCGSGVKGPELGEIPKAQRWVRITGHYDDPAASTCTYRVDEQYPYVATTTAELVESCRARFVVTEIRTE